MEAEREHGTRYDPEQRDRAAELYERACLGGLEHACFFFEQLTVAKRLSAAEFKERQARFRPRCEAGDARACFMWGMAFDDERGFGLEAPRALALYRRACDGGYAYACAEAAKLHVVLWDHPVSVVESRRLVQQACDAGYGRACVVAANFVRAGRGGPRDVPRSRRLLGAACRRGQPDACVRLAKRHIYRDRKGIEPGASALARGELDQLSEPLSRMCGLGHQSACATAVGLVTQPLPEADLKRARDLLEQACRQGRSPSACDRLSVGVLSGRFRAPPRWKSEPSETRIKYIEGLRARHGKQRSVRLGRRCSAGYPDACRQLALMPRIKGETGVQRIQRLDALRERSRRSLRNNQAFELAYYRKGCFEGSRVRACGALASAARAKGSERRDPELSEKAGQRYLSLLKARTDARVRAARQRCRQDDAFSCYRLAAELKRGGTSSAAVRREIERARVKARRLEKDLRARFRAASVSD